MTQDQPLTRFPRTLALGALLLAPAAAQTVRYTTQGFEAPTFVPGPLADDKLNQFGGTGQDDWIATPDASGTIKFQKILVQTAPVWGGAQAVTVNAKGQDFDYMHLRRNVIFDPLDDPSRPVVDVRLRMRIDSSTKPSDYWALQGQGLPGPLGPMFSWGVHPDGAVHYWDPSTGADMDSGVLFTRDAWHDVVTSTDYQARLVTVYIDGAAAFQVVGGPSVDLGLFAFSSIFLLGPGNDKMHFDEYEIISRAQGPLDPPIGVNYCGPGVANSTGSPGEMNAYGSTQASDNNVRLEGVSLPAGQFALFLASQTQGFVTPPGSQGNLCLGGSIARYAQDLKQIGNDGRVELTIDLGAIPTSPPSVVMPGDTWKFQVWHRDNNPGPTSNFTDGLSILFQ
jgi:hypothetical protein